MTAKATDNGMNWNQRLTDAFDVRPKSRAESEVCGRTYRFTVLTSRLLRMEYSPDGIFEDRPSQTVLCRDFPTPEFHVTEREGVLELSTEAFRLTYRGGAFTPDSLRIDAKNRYTNYGACWKYGTDTYGNPPRHHNLMGTARTLDKLDGACPLGFGLLDSSGRSWFDDSGTRLLEEDGSTAPRRPGNTDAYFLCYGHDYTGAIADFYRLCGAPPMVPRWALGNWWSRYRRYTADDYLALMDRFRSEGYPFSVAVLDMDWHKTDIPPEYGRGWTGYSWNRDLFPDPARFLGDLHRRGLHSALNLHPADGVQAYEDAYRDMAVRMGMDPACGDPVRFDAASLRHWDAYFSCLIYPQEDAGADFWWIDWQQGTESGTSGLDPLWALNHYHYLAANSHTRRGMILSRYAGLGSHRYPFGFSGDTVATWSSLTFQPYFTATAANVGYGCWSHDIGGFKAGVRERELYLRWLQFGVFSPVLRMHASNNPFCAKEPWVWGEETARRAKYWFVLRHRLIPYLYTAMHAAHTELVPMLTPLYYRYPDEPDAYCFPNQYFFGPGLLVCPITSPTDFQTGMARVPAWIPDGLWTDVFSGRVYRGQGRTTLARGIDRMPVLAPAGAIIPLASAEDSMETGNPAALDVYIFPGASGQYTLFEDAGDGDGWKTGKCTFTRFRLDWSDGSATLTAETEGDTDLLPASRTRRLHFRGFAPGVRAKGLPGAVYDMDTRTLTVETEPLPPGEPLVVTLENCFPDSGSDRADRVFAFLMQAQLPVETKTAVWKIAQAHAASPARALREIQALRLPEPSEDVLFELFGE